MSDIAKLGFSVNTADLKQAKADLTALVPAAAKVEKASLALAKAEYERARATVAAMRATGTATKEEIAAATVLVRKANAAVAATRADIAGAAAMGKVEAAARGVATGVDAAGNAAQGASAKLSRLGKAANDNLNALQATPANIAAQFQDIGVTAAAGMDPLLIGLQQGAQLGPAFAGGIKGIGAALKQVFSPMSLFAIGLATAIALAIQWGMEFFKAGKKTEEFADKTEKAAFATSALNDAQGILSGVMDIATGKINTQSKALLALARAQLAVAQIESRERMAKADNDINRVTGELSPRYNAAAEKGLFQQDKPLSKLQDDLRSGRKNVDQVIKSLQGMVALGQMGQNTFTDLAKAYANFGVEAENQKVFADAQKLLDGQTTGTSYLLKPEKPASSGKSDGEKLIDVWTGAKADIATENTRLLAAGLEITGEKAATLAQRTKLMNELQTKGLPITKETIAEVDRLAAAFGKAKYAADRAEALTEIVTGSNTQIADLQNQTKMVGLYGRELAYAAAMAQMLADAKNKGLSDTDVAAATPTFQAQAGKIADASEQLREREFMENLIQDAETRNRQLKVEREELGLTGAALGAYRYEQEMLTAAEKAHLNLGPERLAGIKETARLYGEQAEEIRRAREQLEFNRESTRGFFKDFVQGARDGQGAWSAFSNAFNNFMDKLIDKLLNDVLDAVFQVNSAVGGGQGGGGLLGSIGKVLGLVGGSGFGSVQSIMAGANASLGAGSFGMVAPGTFAKGDAFTNTVVSRPTAFAFGKGGANLGIMGEKDPEAVMPLQRGPDGSLGVQMYGDRRQAAAPPQEVTVKIVADDDRFNAYVDTRIGAQAPGIVQAGAAVSQREASFRQTRKLA